MFFNNCTNPGQVKSEYRRLAKLHHPDIGGDTRTMQDINTEYHATLSQMDGYTSIGSDDKEHTYKYNRDIEQAVMDKVIELLKLHQCHWQIEVVGLWVWVSGTTKDDKNLLNKNGAKMRWHSKRNKWYWKPYKNKTRYSNKSFDQLRSYYGSTAFRQEDSAIATA